TSPLRSQPRLGCGLRSHLCRLPCCALPARQLRSRCMGAASAAWPCSCPASGLQSSSAPHLAAGFSSASLASPACGLEPCLASLHQSSAVSWWARLLEQYLLLFCIGPGMFALRPNHSVERTSFPASPPEGRRSRPTLGNTRSLD